MTQDSDYIILDVSYDAGVEISPVVTSNPWATADDEHFGGAGTDHHVTLREIAEWLELEETIDEIMANFVDHLLHEELGVSADTIINGADGFSLKINRHRIHGDVDTFTDDLTEQLEKAAGKYFARIDARLKKDLAPIVLDYISDADFVDNAYGPKVEGPDKYYIEIDDEETPDFALYSPQFKLVKR